jgi:hypothetical protein
MCVYIYIYMYNVIAQIYSGSVYACINFIFFFFFEEINFICCFHTLWHRGDLPWKCEEGSCKNRIQLKKHKL